MSLISKCENDELFWGTFIEPTKFCKKDCDSEKCRACHKSIKDGEFITCHKGMTIYRTGDTVYFSARVKGYYKKNKCVESDDSYNPVITESKFLCLIDQDQKYCEIIRDRELKQESEKRLRHEIKNLNSQIKDISEDIIQSFFGDGEEGINVSSEYLNVIGEKLRTINVSSSIIMSRYALDDYEKNPTALVRGQFECNVYMKFDKIRKVLNNYEKKGVFIQINGNSYMKIKAYPSFEMIPLILLENAVKYSNRGGVVSINFEEKEENMNTILVVTVSSYGPACTREEINKIFDKGYRGVNAKKKADGSGIGLYFAKILCDLHEIELKVIPGDNLTQISGVDYSTFQAKLIIRNLIS